MSVRTTGVSVWGFIPLRSPRSQVGKLVVQLPGEAIPNPKDDTSLLNVFLWRSDA